jgi:pyrimidine-nucleoside phosphorylase/thymidine phosphorylase
MLTPALIIQRKRDGKELSREQIHGFIRGLSTGDVADYQATAFLMAVYFRGMSLDETVALTEAMLESGERYDLSRIPGPKVDKHSTGGVGDKVSLILAPLAAACGLRVPMMSGRGLGHTGGTLDKLESISGFDVRLDRARFEHVLESTGCAMIGQTERMVPADRKLYALRDVTGTVECIPLIVASILSKKLAEGAEALVLDVKVGSGAFMKSRADARRLAKTLTAVAKKMKLPCRAVLTSMSQPLGYATGNALEVVEAIEVLRNDTPPSLASGDLKELTIQLCAQMLELGGVVRNLTEGRKLAHGRLADGSAWGKFEDMVGAQGGALDQIRDPSKLPHASRSATWGARKRGYVAGMDTQALGQILVELGGGRKKAEDSVDPRVGLVFHKKLGSRVQVGEPIVTVHAPEKLDLEELESKFQAAVDITGARKPVPKLILEVMG